MRSNTVYRKNGVRFCCSLIFCGLACRLFINPVWLRLLLSVPAAFFLSGTLRHRQVIRQRLLSREQFKWFLELLLTRLSSGATLERAISDTIPGMQQMLGKKSTFLNALYDLEKKLQAGRSLDGLLLDLARKVECEEAGYFFKILPELQRTGSQLILFVRQFLQMVSQKLSLQQTYSAETSQRRTEALLLSVMPFAMTLLNKTSFDMQTPSAMSQPIGLFGMALGCFLALTACILTLHFSVFDPDQKPVTFSAPLDRKIAKPFHVLANKLIFVYRSFLPEVYSARLLQYLFSLDRQSQKNLTLSFFSRKARLMLAGFLPGLLFCVATPAGFVCLLVFPLLLSFLHDQQLLRLRRQVLFEYQLLYPIWINLVTALLQSGLTLHRAFLIAGHCLQSPGKHEYGLLFDLELMQKQIHSGQPIDRILQDMLTACPLPEAQAALLLLTRYEQTGVAETLQMLEMQSTACWASHQNAKRKQLEQQSVRLLAPMMLDLIAVLLTAMMPAVLSLLSL